MKILWAPWRMDFILGPREKGCVFCKLRRTKNDRDNLILFRGKLTYLVLNKFPYNNGHLMVVPNRHLKDLSGLTAKESAEMMQGAALATKALELTMRPHGFNLGMNLGAAAGAGILGHLHLHVVPRWQGDTHFMPILGHTKVMVEYLHETYDRLLPVLRRLLKNKKRRTLWLCGVL